MIQEAAIRTRHPYYADIENIRKRMKRIEGQAKGIQRMLDEDRYCIDIVQQLTALSKAADEVAMIIMENHIEGCVSHAIREQHGAPYIKELMATIRKTLKR